MKMRINEAYHRLWEDSERSQASAYFKEDD